MKKKQSSDDVTNWVIGKEFSREKLMTPLSEVDNFFKIAEFGFSNYEESLETLKLSIEEINFKKVVGFKLLVSTLILIIDNSKFAIFNNRKEMLQYLNKLEIINDMIDNKKLFKIIGHNKAKIKKNYKVVLDITRKIKSKINTPLYKNNLIYITKENYDPLEYKQKVLDDLANA